VAKKKYWTLPVQPRGLRNANQIHDFATDLKEHEMKSRSVCIGVFVFLAQFAAVPHASAAECPAYIPAGVVIRMFPDEKLIAGSSSGPTIFTVSSDLRFFPNRPPLLARGSKVLGDIAESKEAGRIYGKARLKITLRSILTSDLCEYPIDAKIIEAAHHRVQDEVVFGRGHAHRDVVALLFPPTTIYQLLRIPSRGPKLILDHENALNIKLMEPLSLGEAPARLSQNERTGPLGARTDQTAGNFSEVKAEFGQQAPRLEQRGTGNGVSGACSVHDFPALPIVRATTILRPVRNLTPYHVSLYIDRKPVLILPPCYGPSTIATPATEFHLEAIATVLTAGGQKQITLKVVPSPGNKGWDVVADDDERIALSYQ
jgi:hypothetical protein